MGYVEAKTVVKEQNLEECAKSMLEIFRSRNVASGQSLMASDVYIAFVSRGWSGTDYASAIQYAKSQDWIKDEGAEVTLLEAGFIATGLWNNYTSSKAKSPTSG